MLQNEQRVDLQQVFMMKNWDVVIFQLPNDKRCLSCRSCVSSSAKCSITRNYKWTYDKYKPSENIPCLILRHVWNKEVYDKYVEDTGGIEFDFARDFHTHVVPIIELNGFISSERELGDPIIHTPGEIVRIFAGDGDQCIGIHVTTLKEFLKCYTGKFFLPHHSYNLHMCIIYFLCLLIPIQFPFRNVPSFLYIPKIK